MRSALVAAVACAALLVGCGSSAPGASSPPAAPAISAAPLTTQPTTSASGSSQSGWHRVQGLPKSAGGSLRSVIAGSGGFTAVGSSGLRGPGAAWTSADGTTWQATPGDAALSAMPLDSVVATGAGLTAFGVPCVGTDECVTAAEVTFDGKTWTAVPAFVGDHSEEPVRFASMGGHFVGVGTGAVTISPVVYVGRIWNSTTGNSWAQVPDAPDFARAQITDVVVGPKGFVAVGSVQSGSQSGTDASVWTSVDGSHWKRLASQPDFTDAAMLAIVARPSGFVAVGQGTNGAAIWTSADGTSWVRSAGGPSLHDATMYGVANVGSGLMAAGYGHDSAAIWTSTDATTWTRLPDDPAFAMAQAVAIAAIGDEVVVVGGANGQTSPKAIIWSNH